MTRNPFEFGEHMVLMTVVRMLVEAHIEGTQFTRDDFLERARKIAAATSESLAPEQREEALKGVEQALETLVTALPRSTGGEGS